MRVYEFAKEFDKDSREFIHELREEFGFKIKSHLSGISEEQMQEVKAHYKKRDHDMDQEGIDLKLKLMNQDLEVRLKELDQKQDQKQEEEETVSKISDMIGKEEEGTIHHKEAMKETFNEGFFDQTSPQEKTGDTIPLEETKKEPEFISYDLIKDEETKKLKKENEKAVQNTIESAENARKEYAKTVHKITEDPDNWATPSVNTQQEVIVEKQHWLSRLFGWWSGG